jgi:hypothetical protein
VQALVDACLDRDAERRPPFAAIVSVLDVLLAKEELQHAPPRRRATHEIPSPGSA